MHVDHTLLNAFQNDDLPTPLPCPCCGEEGPFKATKEGVFSGIDTGHLMGTVMGVVCYGCGLKIGRDLPNDAHDRWGPKWPDLWELRLLEEAILAWNRRAG